MLEWLEQLTQRPVVIALALAGASAATVGSPVIARRLGIAPGIAHWLLRGGYAVTWASITLFIVAGFLPR